MFEIVLSLDIFSMYFFRAGYEFFWSFIGIFMTPKDKKTLHGKITIVTGAGQGINLKNQSFLQNFLSRLKKTWDWNQKLGGLNLIRPLS